MKAIEESWLFEGSRCFDSLRSTPSSPGTPGGEGWGGLMKTDNHLHPLFVAPDEPREFRPEGAETNQPRATPWGLIGKNSPSPERARQTRALGRLLRPFRAKTHR